MNEEWLARKICFCENLATAWSEAGIDWAVCNGLADYPKDIGRDLDVVTAPGDRRKALEVTVEVMSQEGFTPLAFRLGWVYWTVGFRWYQGKIESVQIDLFDHLQWAFTWVVDGAGQFGNVIERGPFRDDPAASVGKRLVINALSGGYDTFVKKPHYLEISEAENEVLPALIEKLAGEAHPPVVEALRRGDLEKIKSEMTAYRKQVMRHAVFSGDRWLRRMHSAFQKQWNINLFPGRAVPIVSVEASDLELQQQVFDRFIERSRQELVFCDVDIHDNRPHHLYTDTVKRPWQAFADYLIGDRCRMRRRSALQYLQCFRGHALGLALSPDREGLVKFPLWMAKRVRKPDLRAFVLSEGEDASVVDEFKIDELIAAGGGTSAAADRVFEALIGQLDHLSRQQYARLGLHTNNG